jgi:hypothetical protein
MPIQPRTAHLIGLGLLLSALCLSGCRADGQPTVAPVASPPASASSDSGTLGRPLP